MDKSQLLHPEIQAFIRDNENADLPKMIMQKKHADLPIQEIAEQIKSRRKAKEKLPTWYKTKGVLYPPSVSIEQSSSEITAEYKTRLLSGKSALDLTGGFGVDSYYLSKKYDSLTYVEESEDLVSLVRHNYSVFKQANINIVSSSAENFIDQNKDRFDLIYIDPDRRPGNMRARGFEDSKPDLLRLLPSLLRISDKIIVKASPMLDISLALSMLKNVEKVTVLAVANEVKELLFTVGKQVQSDPQIRCVNLITNPEQLHKYNLSERPQEECPVSELEKYLYEPNAAILKSGGYNLLCERYGLEKLNRNTHLYTSNGLVGDFPGRVFEVGANAIYNKRSVLAHLETKKANISVRNFPDTPEQVKKKLGLKDGGNQYLFGYRDQNDKPRVAICVKF